MKLLNLSNAENGLRKGGTEGRVQNSGKSASVICERPLIETIRLKKYGIFQKNFSIMN